MSGESGLMAICVSGGGAAKGNERASVTPIVFAGHEGAVLLLFCTQSGR